jgi:hypothetical protein
VYDEKLTVNNFTFKKVELGLNDPEKEVIRVAKRGPPPKVSLNFTAYLECTCFNLIAIANKNKL